MNDLVNMLPREMVEAWDAARRCSNRLNHGTRGKRVMWTISVRGNVGTLRKRRTGRNVTDGGTAERGPMEPLGKGRRYGGRCHKFLHLPN